MLRKLAPGSSNTRWALMLTTAMLFGTGVKASTALASHRSLGEGAPIELAAAPRLGTADLRAPLTELQTERYEQRQLEKGRDAVAAEIDSMNETMRQLTPGPQPQGAALKIQQTQFALQLLGDKLKQLEQQMDQRQASIDAKLLPLADPIEKARLGIIELGVDFHLEDWMASENLIGALDFARAWQEATGIQLKDLSPAGAKEVVWAAMVPLEAQDIMIENLSLGPGALFESPRSLLDLWNRMPQLGLERAATLENACLRATALDLEPLSKLSGEAFAQLLALGLALDSVDGAPASIQFHATPNKRPETELSRLIQLAPVMAPGGQATVRVFNPGDDSLLEISLDQDQLLSGVAELARFGVSFEARATELAAILGNGSPALQQRVREVLSRVELQGFGRELESIAELCVNNGSIIDRQLSNTDTVVKRLGRKLSFGEFVATALAFERGGSQDIFCSASALHAAQQIDGAVPLKDLYTWEHLSAEEQRCTREDLKFSIEERLGTITARRDLESEYSERFSDYEGQLSTGELHKIKLLLDQLGSTAVQAQLASLVAADIANPNSELGGLIVLGNEGASFEAHASSNAGNGSYQWPFMLEPLRALTTFHLHATGAEGDPDKAGPSSGIDASGGDRWSAFYGHQDGVVITYLGDCRANVDFYTASGAVVNLRTLDLP